MKHETIKEFCKSASTSRSTIYRFYKKNTELFIETKIKDRKRVIPITHRKYFNLNIMHDEYNLLSAENRSMKNLIDGLMDKDSLCRRLWEMPWSYFFTVAYKLDRDKKSCYRMMASLHDELSKKFDESTIRIFFTTEPFVNKKGHHNHFVLYVKDNKIHDEVIAYIHQFFIFNRIDYGKYDPYKAGLFYMAKEGLINEDWDIFGSDLTKGNY